MSEEYNYGQFTPEHLNKMGKGIQLFNEQKYWECHEEYEDLWMEDRMDNARNVYWAIIQVSAALIHYRDDKIIGAQGMIKKAKEKFKNCEKLGVETSILYQYLDWQKLKALVFGIPEKSELEDFKELFEFKFLNFPWDGV